MKVVDARKEACPKPVIMTKKALEESNENIITIVDNKVAKTNVLKLCTKLGYNTDVKEEENGIYITIVKSEENVDENLSTELGSITYVFGSDLLGKGSEELGKILMKGFIYTLTETNPLPSNIVFLNSGVKITTTESQTIDDLKKLEECGTKILSCGTCLDYYNLKDNLLVGEISNMYDIVETMSNAEKTIML